MRGNPSQLHMSLQLNVSSMSFVVDAIRKARISATDAISDRVSLYLQAPVSTDARSLRKQYGRTLVALAEDRANIVECQPLHVEGGRLVDSSGRTRTLKGVNVDGSMKLPASPTMASYDGSSSDRNNIFFDGDNVLFVGRPFPLEEAEQHFSRIKSWGYNTIRYLVTWEALEHQGPGIYDEEFIDYTVKMLRLIHRIGGLYVFLECHQDVWSRFCGGSGAPMWTLYAAGLDPKCFDATEAAMIHNSDRYSRAPNDPECYTKMLWTTNYRRLALLTMFTLFFAGETYFPNLKLDGMSIQKYLQLKLFASLAKLWEAAVSELPDMVADGTLVGFELLNEPNCGLVGQPRLDVLPDSQQLRLDTTPTTYQSFLLGMGIPVQVDTYKIAVTGPQKSGSRIVDPRGQTAWLLKQELESTDKHYGWIRQGWTGECIYLASGIWSWDSTGWEKVKDRSQLARVEFGQNHCTLKRPRYFSKVTPRLSFDTPDDTLPDVIDTKFFINTFFVDFYISHKQMVRSICPGAFVLIQPPVLELPPKLVDDARRIIDEKTIYCPHYYDGMSLMFKTWNSRYNVDTLGIMRGRYFNPVLGIVFGERAIRNCIKQQFIAIATEGRDNLGPIPILMSETGMPFDMDGKKAYEDGSYSLQTAALDAIAVALEVLGIHHTFWCYTSINCHSWGDRWNNEDFSLWSSEDRDLCFDDHEIPARPSSRRNSVTPSLKTLRSLRQTDGYQLVIRAKLSYRRKRLLSSAIKLALGATCEGDEHKLATPMETSSSTESAELISLASDNLRYQHLKKCYPSPDGVRAPSAVIRPFVVATYGVVKYTEFEMRPAKFTLTLSFSEVPLSSPTVIFVPKWHYPCLDYGDIYLTSGTVRYNEVLEFIEWYHSQENGREEVSIIIKNNSGRIEDIEPRSSSRRLSVTLLA